MTGKVLFIASVSALCLAIAFAAAAGESTPADRRAEARRQMALGNYKDAGDILRPLVVDPAATPADAAKDLADLTVCLRNLGDPVVVDPLLEETARVWSGSWRVLAAVAKAYGELPPMAAAGDNGVMMRVPYWSGGNRHAGERDRVAALRLLLQAELLLDADADPATAADKSAFYSLFVDTIMLCRSRSQWRLTALTDLNEIPDLQDYLTFYFGDNRNAPVDADGNPVYYRTPASWEEAKNDGERWRWLLGRLAETGGDAGRDHAAFILAGFLHDQFGVHTMGRFFPVPDAAEADAGTGSFAVRTLAENETIARLATGVKRFTLPDEFDFIRILRRLSDGKGLYRDRATATLGHIFTNRQQYDKAVAIWRKAEGNEAKQALERITGKNGVLESGPVAPAGRTTAIPFLFRNGDKVTLTAHRLDEQRLLAEIRDRLKGDSDDFFENYVLRRPELIGRLVVERDAGEYLGEKVAEWTVDLSPLPGHYSSRVNIDLPFSDAGCYLVEAAMDGGNTSRVVLWIADLVLAKKAAGRHQIIYVADAVTGEPVPGADIAFLGFSLDFDGDNAKRKLVVNEFADRTDANGLLVLDKERLDRKEWLITAETADGRRAFYGFDSIWVSPWRDEPSTPLTAFCITDRPVYRPKQTVNFKVWLGAPSYAESPGTLEGRELEVVIQGPGGDEVYKKTLTADSHGGVADSLVLGDDARLGTYWLMPRDAGGALSFRLEEYKKPEYEVTVETPDKALALGDAAQIKIKAAYYYGAPVTDARVTYKVIRTPFANTWFPPWRWDWLYGAGRWQCSYDYAWLPGWSDWGPRMPAPPWIPHRFVPPEVVAEGEGTLDTDGVFRLTVDTRPARELYGNQDHEYRVSVEVTDRSRRTIAGEGRVVASRKPFAVAVWTDRGFHTVGQSVNAGIQARLPLGGGVRADGRAVLRRINYAADGTPRETEVRAWDIATDDQGAGLLRLSADEPGQYRLSCTLTDAAGNTVEGAAVLTIRGEPGGGDFRFAKLELVPDRRDYRPGDIVKLAVNTEKKDAVVVLLLRAERNGHAGADDPNASPEPALLRLANGSDIVPIPVGVADQPNFFCEAMTVYDGQIHIESREIFVPPADKTLNVQVESDADSYAPGAKAAFTVKVTDADGKPVAGQCVVSVYDKAVEYISGGGNVADIRERFWGKKRSYSPRIGSTLDRHGYRLTKPGDSEWVPLGIFGAQEADWNDDMVYTNGAVPEHRMTMRRMAVVETDMAAGGGLHPPVSPPVPSKGYTRDRAQSLDAVGPAAVFQVPVPGEKRIGGQPMEEPALRSEFADTAFWNAALETNADGVAEFVVDMPDNLTAWKARTWTMAGGTRVGAGEDAVETKKNIIVRPQAPRFLTQKDQVILSANLHNYLPRAKSARAELVLEGGLLEPADGVELTRGVELAADGEARVDWLVAARRPGEARVVMRLLTDEESDAAALTLPVLVHGARRVESFTGVVRDDATETVIAFTVPEERLAEQSRLELAVSPSIALAMLEALPFLVDYPYGCTEQTLNRFLPAVMTRKYLDRLGLTLADAQAALEASPADARAPGRSTPVLDDKELAAMVREGVERLTAMQNADGGWGWFSGVGEKSWPHTTAVVMHGLAAARDNGVAVPRAVFDRGLDWLQAYRARQLQDLRKYRKGEDGEQDEGKAKADNLDAFVHMILRGQNRGDADMADFLHRDRLDLSLTGLSMLGLALQMDGDAARLDIVLRNLEQFLEENADIGTAWLKTPARGWWWWYNSSVETQVWYLKLLCRTDAAGPRASAVAKHLLRNRKNGSHWNSTRDTAYAIEALSEYAVASGETEPDMTATVFLDGKQVMERRLTRRDILADNRLVLAGLAVETGEHELRVVRSGRGNLYYSGALDLFSLEDPVAKAGLELKVERSFYKLEREDAARDLPAATGQAVAAKVEKYRRVRLPSPFDPDPDATARLEAGDLVEVELTIEAANDYEYLVFEDMKAAGLEAVELRSGYTANRLGAYVEYRDQKVVLFVRYLPQGKYTLSYRFRAEIPGGFSALPTFGRGMYATDLFGNSDEMKVRIVEPGVFE